MNNPEKPFEYKTDTKADAVKLPKILILGAIAAGAVCAVLFSVLLFTSFDSDIGYFKENFPKQFTYALTALLCIAVAVISCSIKKGSVQIEGMARKYSLSCLIPAVAMAGNAFFSIYALSHNLFPWLTEHGKDLRWMLVVWILLSLAASVYFCFVAIGKVNEKYVPLGFAAVLQSAVPIAITYSDVYVTMNSPEKTGIELACAAFMLLMTAELRFILDKPAPGLITAIYCIAFIVCASVYIPFLIGHIAGIMTYSKYLWFLISGALCTVYILIRIIALYKCIRKTELKSEPAGQEDR